MNRFLKIGILILLFGSFLAQAQAQAQGPDFKVIAFYAAKNDLAHISFAHEANKWFNEQAQINHFLYDSTQNWENMNPDYLKKYDLILFLDTRPEAPEQRATFKNYMENGGAWMGFHFSGFALTPSDYPQNWDWYHEDFLGSGEYKGNTWRPTSAVLRVEIDDHPVTKNLPTMFTSAPNEWYSWQKNLRENPDIQVLLSIDPKSFPLGTGPKPHEIWHNGDYPVVWTNTKYRMVYFNMGHNDMDYDNGTNKQLSSTFQSKEQNALILNSLLWLGSKK